MTSRRIKLGSFVKKRRKTKPDSIYGKVKSEAGKKVWNVLFYGNGCTEEKKSAQLSFVKEVELPMHVSEWFKPPKPTPTSTTPASPVEARPVPEKEGNTLDHEKELHQQTCLC